MLNFRIIFNFCAEGNLLFLLNECYWSATLIIRNQKWLYYVTSFIIADGINFSDYHNETQLPLGGSLSWGEFL